MGLGGLTRDSIVGLNNLVKDDDEIQPRTIRRLSGSFDSGSIDKHKFLFLMDETGSTAAAAASQSTAENSFETSLNDGVVPQRPVTPLSAVPPTPYRVSATNSRSLDSYRTNGNNSSSTSQTDYQGFNYEGYTDYYAESYDYDYQDYEDSCEDNVLCCLFPWAFKKDSEDADAIVETENEEVKSSSGDTTDSAVLSTPTPALGENENQGTPSFEKTPHYPAEKMNPASLHASKSNVQGSSHFEESGSSMNVQLSSDASATSTASSTSADSPLSVPGSKVICPASKNTSVADSVEMKEKEPRAIKGILKKRTIAVVPATTSTADDISSKRQLFPSYSQSSSSEEKKSIDFNPMARVLTIASRKDFPLSQKCQIWWQRHDYDEFKKSGRIISKAMECGGSEIWLASSNAWGLSQSRQNANKDREHNDSEEYNKALSKYVGEEKKDDEHGDDFGSKWWCKFGHSRRGLEHIASASEGKARQHSVLLSIRMTLEEQRRQRATRTKDPNKLRNVSMQYTSWARDLALAAGTADAEAVSSNFNRAAKSRAHHFAKQVCGNTHLYSADVGGGVAMAVTSQLLDANTHGGKLTRNASHGRRSSRDLSSDHSYSGASLSKRAKGFMPGGNDISASAVLSGMGT